MTVIALRKLAFASIKSLINPIVLRRTFKCLKLKDRIDKHWCLLDEVTHQTKLFLGIVDSLGSMQLLARGAGGGGEKVAPPKEAPHPQPQPAAAPKPPVPPKPQVRTGALAPHCVSAAPLVSFNKLPKRVGVCVYSLAGPAQRART